MEFKKLSKLCFISSSSYKLLGKGLCRLLWINKFFQYLKKVLISVFIFFQATVAHKLNKENQQSEVKKQKHLRLVATRVFNEAYSALERLQNGVEYGKCLSATRPQGHLLPDNLLRVPGLFFPQTFRLFKYTLVFGLP